jgi:phosphonoacetate hydrolase
MSETNTPRPTRLFLMAWDGLRPDLISHELTPNLAKLRDAGTFFANNHAVVPTVTRINTATLATGAPSSTHGLPVNSFYAYKIEPREVISIGEGDSTARLREAYGVFAAPTISDVVKAAGGRSAIVSSGTRGSSQMLHPRRIEAGDYILHPTLSTAEEVAFVAGRLGSPMPEADVPDTPRNRWLAEAIAKVVVPELKPDVLVFWHDDPDKSQHEYGVAHPISMQAIRDADTHFGIVLDGLEAAGLRDETLVVVASDHGYVQITNRISADDLAWVSEIDGAHFDIAGNGCTLLMYRRDGQRDEAPEAVAQLAARLARQTGIGVVFSGARGAEVVAGTLPLAALEMDGPLAPDLLVTLSWSDDLNEHGRRGVGYGYATSNEGSHGGGSSWEIHNTLIMQGPGIKRGLRSEPPSGIGDIAPTVLTMLGLTPPPSMTGRILREAFVDAGVAGPSPAADAPDGDWEDVSQAGALAWSRYGGRAYLNAIRRGPRSDA